MGDRESLLFLTIGGAPRAMMADRYEHFPCNTGAANRGFPDHHFHRCMLDNRLPRVNLNAGTIPP